MDDVDHLRVVGRTEVGLFGLFDESGDLAAAGRLRRLRRRIPDSGEMGMVAMVTSAPDCVVLFEHELVVHLVDVVAGEDDDVLGLLAADGVDVLVDGVGGALVPVLADALHGGKDLDELAEFVGDDRPQPSRMWRLRESALYWVRM